MAPCLRYTFEECLERAGITDPNSADAELLCTPKDFFPEKISAATIAIIIYLFTNIYIQIVESSLVLKNSRIWGRTTTTTTSEESGHYEEGRKAILHSAVLNCVLGFILYVGTTIMISNLNYPLDARANNIVVGFSQLFSGVIFCITSICIPQWFGIYHSNKRMKVSYTSSKEIRFNLSWNLWKQLSSMFFFNLYFSCAADATGLSVLWGALLGFPCAFLCLFITRKARSTKYEKYKGKLSVVMVIIFGTASWFTVFSGIYFINDVWLPDDDEDTKFLVTFGYSIIWILVLVGCHLVLHFWTRDKQSKGRITTRFTSQMFGSKQMQNLTNTIEKEEDEEEGHAGTDVAANPAAVGDVGNNKDIVDVSLPSSSSSDKEGQDEKSRKVGFASDVKDDDDNRPSMDNTDNKHVLYVEPKDAPSYWKLFMTKLVDTFPFFCGCCLEEKYHVDNISRRRLDYVIEGHEKSRMESVGLGIRRFAWYFLSFFFFFLTVININASYEQCAAKNALPAAFAELYPSDYITGTMCAWDKNGPPGPNSTIKEFETVQAVNDANYEIIHCGGCGACSNWNDIQLQYTTTQVLAGISKVCAKKSIGITFNEKDDNDPVVQCNHLQLGFTLPCAKAWAWDEVNTKNHALFTFLQARLSNAFADMKVSYQDITMATIDEAISGPTFVPEVGATRRRMNIISDIKRPESQQCKVATQNWTEVFKDPFYPPVGGTYTIQLPGEPAEEVVVIGQDGSSS